VLTLARPLRDGLMVVEAEEPTDFVADTTDVTEVNVEVVNALRPTYYLQVDRPESHPLLQVASTGGAMWTREELDWRGLVRPQTRYGYDLEVDGARITHATGLGLNE